MKSKSEPKIITFNITQEVLDQLDELIKGNDTDRSKTIRKLIRKEYEIRNITSLPRPEGGQFVPVVHVEEVS